jgi:hypothetical protein
MNAERASERAAKTGDHPKAAAAHSKAAEIHEKAAESLQGEAKQQVVETAKAHREKAEEHSRGQASSLSPRSIYEGGYSRGDAKDALGHGSNKRGETSPHAKKYPVGAEVTTAGGGQVFHGGGSGQHYGKVVGHHPETGHPIVKFESGHERPVNPSREHEGLDVVSRPRPPNSSRTTSPPPSAAAQASSARHESRRQAKLARAKARRQGPST